MIIRYRTAANYIRDHFDLKPKIGIILGSGLDILEKEKDVKSIDYRDIPYFPVSTVEGHAGKLGVYEIEGVPTLVMRGRFHYYEGYSLAEVTFPIRVMKLLGIEILIVTNASGGINPSFKPGDIMLIEDHINLMGNNPLIGRNEEVFGPRFPDMTQAYDRELLEIAQKAAKDLGIDVKKGVYMAVAGPSYETPAEIRAFERLGADAIGMSTVPEVIVARHCGIRVLGISSIANLAAGKGCGKLSHEDVVEGSRKSAKNFERLLTETIKRIGFKCIDDPGQFAY